MVGKYIYLRGSRYMIILELLYKKVCNLLKNHEKLHGWFFTNLKAMGILYDGPMVIQIHVKLESSMHEADMFYDSIK